MAPTFPSLSMYPHRAAEKQIVFMVGSTHNPRRFDIHQHLLCKSSSLFNLPNGDPYIMTQPIILPNIDPDAFGAIYMWLYTAKPPTPSLGSDLQLLMEMWVALAALGIRDKMNTIMRLGMALMQPKEHTCPISIVKWVYEHTHPHSKLRGYIIAIFCQRGPAPTGEVFNAKGGIMKDAVKFFGTLNKVRAGNPRDINGYMLTERFATVQTYQPSEVPRRDGQFFRTVITGGKDVDKSRVEYPLPDYLVWDEKWQDLPDEQFFVRESDEFQEGGEVLKQLQGMK